MNQCKDCKWYFEKSCGSLDAFPTGEFSDGIYIKFAERVAVGPNFGCIHWRKDISKEIKLKVIQLADSLGVSLSDIERAIR